MALPAHSVLAFRYRLGRPLGRGGSAHTYVAEDLLEGREVALKLLDRARPLADLRREFERLRGLAHPHLLQVRDFALVQLAGEQRALYTAELVRGGDLRSFVQRFGLARARPALGDVLDALHLLHQLGLRHGDVKPENVLVDERGRGVLLDLGCAAPLGQAQALLSGTPGYLAPELLAGEPADERADLFAFGVMLRELSAAGELATLSDRLTRARPGERPSSARELLALLGDGRNVAESARGRAASCVGRERELTRAQAALESARAGAPGPRCVWLEGPPGVGRSRLLRELAFALASRGVQLLEADGQAPAPVRAALARREGELAPGLEALLEQLATAAEREPCVLLLDDAQKLLPEARLELAFVLRSLPEHGRLALLVASTEPPPESAAVCRIALAALDDEALAHWAAGRLVPGQLAAFSRFTGGYPRYVERTLWALDAGSLRAEQLAEQPALSVDEQSGRALALALAGLAPAELSALAELALLGELAEAPRRLLDCGLVAARGPSFVLVREADRAPLLAELDPELVRRVAARTARALARRTLAPDRELDVALSARTIELYARAGLREQARALFERAWSAARAAPRTFAQRLAEVSFVLLPAQRVALAQLLRLSGEAQRALRELAAVRRGCASPPLFQEAAEVYLALGQPRRAERVLARSPELLQSELYARLLVRRGAYEQARAVAARALELVSEASERARLLETLALCASYLGDPDTARAQVAAALTLHPAADLRGRARCTALRGFVLLRAGAALEAADAYAEALALAEPAGLSDLVVNAVSNLASARQSLGHWGAALATYERALRLALGLGRRASVRSLRLNLANLALEIGAFERAQRELEALEQGVETAALELSLALYRAELELLTGQAEAALARSRALSEQPATPPRERLEAQLLTLLATVVLGERTQIERALAQLPEERDECALDLLARRADAEARALARLERPQLAVQRLERALERVRPRAEQALLARLESELARLYRELSADTLAAEHAARARARWERIALDLPATWRDPFWAHPHRKALASAAPAALRPARASLSFARVRELNRRIGGLHRREEVLTFALDAAIELTAAERGFVLLSRAGEGGFEVAAARHMDQARVRRSDWKWSRSIAERVIREGEPVLTVDAERDPRFAKQASVHAMQLKSVLCAPIRGRGEVLGALYLDNRLLRARFALADSELLLAFADQVAIALQHAELVCSLEEKARELSREKRKVEELARGQARELERLSEELSAQRVALGMRYDYESIVGRSEPMRRVLALLDRVIDTDLSVLIEGESGTGKELIARALHTHSARKHRPFVGINCAALPEALLESELFGHEKGAFTGASSAREGLFASARGGTLFLDELGELPLSMQAKLLRVLNDGEVRPVGAAKSFAVDVRLVCATNRKLKERVAQGLFREDLYYRVSVVELTLPALRDRHEDIVPIAEALLRRRAEELKQPPLKLSSDAIRALLSHPFPGNVRELQNTLLRASVMASGGVITRADLGLSNESSPARQRASTRREYAQKEAERLLAALESERWNVSKVAKNLGIPRNTLYRKLTRYGIQRSGDP